MGEDRGVPDKYLKQKQQQKSNPPSFRELPTLVLFDHQQSMPVQYSQIQANTEKQKDHKPKNDCPERKCATQCSEYAKDKHGCPTCECKITPTTKRTLAPPDFSNPGFTEGENLMSTQFHAMFSPSPDPTDDEIWCPDGFQHKKNECGHVCTNGTACVDPIIAGPTRGPLLSSLRIRGYRNKTRVATMNIQGVKSHPVEEEKVNPSKKNVKKGLRKPDEKKPDPSSTEPTKKHDEKIEQQRKIQEQNARNNREQEQQLKQHKKPLQVHKPKKLPQHSKRSLFPVKKTMNRGNQVIMTISMTLGLGLMFYFCYMMIKGKTKKK